MAEVVGGIAVGAGEPAVREMWQWPQNRGMAASILVLAIVLAAFCWKGDVWGLGLGWPWMARLLVSGAVILAGVWCCLLVLFRPRQTIADFHLCLPPTPVEAYAQYGLGPLPEAASPRELYLDQVKRAVANILYEDPPYWFYDHRRQPSLAAGFSLARRVRGEDSPTLAHTMIGIERLNNLQYCVEEVLREGVPGDLIETGSYRGGATIFMRAILKAHGVCDRRVCVCDTFVPPSPPQPPLLVMPILQALAAIPSKAWRRSYFLFLQRLPKRQQAFPDLLDPSDDFVEFVLWNLRNPVAFNSVDPTNLDRVKSTFARYGLLDEQVVFLQGFFADTLPQAALSRLAVVRLDGDTYESTWDAITQLYPKLSPGGFLIVDDYGSFRDCRSAIEEYRQQNGIGETIQSIDNLAVYWKKSPSRT